MLEKIESIILILSCKVLKKKTSKKQKNKGEQERSKVKKKSKIEDKTSMYEIEKLGVARIGRK